MLCMLLICQSSFFVSFMHLHNKEIKMKNMLDPDDPKNNIHVADMKEKNRIDLYITLNSFSCSFNAKYRILDILEDITIYNVKTETLLSLDSDICLITYDVY